MTSDEITAIRMFPRPCQRPGDRFFETWRPRGTLPRSGEASTSVSVSEAKTCPAIQLLLEGLVILNDAVVDDEDFARRSPDGDGHFLRTAFRGSPSGCGLYPPVRWDVRAGQLLFQFPDLADRSKTADFAFFKKRDAARIVAAVLEPLESLKQHRQGRLSAEISR